MISGPYPRHSDWGETQESALYQVFQVPIDKYGAPGLELRAEAGWPSILPNRGWPHPGAPLGSSMFI